MIHGNTPTQIQSALLICHHWHNIDGVVREVRLYPQITYQNMGCKGTKKKREIPKQAKHKLTTQGSTEECVFRSFASFYHMIERNLGYKVYELQTYGVLKYRRSK